jgi:exo-beta-1,3-glucanase (GH17 family)
MSRRAIATACVAILLVTGALTGCNGGKKVQPPHEGIVRVFTPLTAEQRITSAVCYGPHRDGQRPGGPDPTAAQIREDLQLMLPHWTLLRLYGSSEVAETVLGVISADAMPMKVMLGAWIGEDDVAANELEVREAIRLAKAYPDIVVAVSVGNETQVSWAAHRSPLPPVIEHVRKVREEVSVPVTSADDLDYWILPESRELARELDFITLHAHPLWKGETLDEALPWLKDRLAAVRELHADRPVVIGETGWATSVASSGEQAELIKGTAGEAEQAVFYDQVRDWAEAEGETVFWFEAFDEQWKGGDDPDEVEKHWGLYFSDRTPKQALRP